MILNLRKTPIFKAFWKEENTYQIELFCYDISDDLKLLNKQGKVIIEYNNEYESINYYDINNNGDLVKIDKLYLKGNDKQVIQYLKDWKVID